MIDCVVRPYLQPDALLSEQFAVSLAHNTDRASGGCGNMPSGRLSYAEMIALSRILGRVGHPYAVNNGLSGAREQSGRWRLPTSRHETHTDTPQG